MLVIHECQAWRIVHWVRHLRAVRGVVGRCQLVVAEVIPRAGMRYLRYPCRMLHDGSAGGWPERNILDIASDFFERGASQCGSC